MKQYTSVFIFESRTALDTNPHFRISKTLRSNSLEKMKCTISVDAVQNSNNSSSIDYETEIREFYFTWNKLDILRNWEHRTLNFVFLFFLQQPSHHLYQNSPSPYTSDKNKTILKIILLRFFSSKMNFAFCHLPRL